MFGFEILKSISKQLPIPLIPMSPVRILAPPGAVSILEDDKLIIHMPDGRTVEYPIPPFGNVERVIYQNGMVEYIIHIGPSISGQK